MITAAERIVSEEGLASLTLKSVRVAAGQANKSAATYHFGSREGMLTAVIDNRMSRADERRRVMIAEIVDGCRSDVRALVEALILPLAEETLYRPGSHYARFLTQAIHDPVLAAHIENHMSAGSYRQIRRMLTEAVSSPREIAGWRVRHVIILTINIMATWEGRQRTASQTDAIVADAVDTCVAVLNAPSTAQPDSEERTP